MSENGEIVTKWVPVQDPHLLRRMGKLGEEVNELGCVASRIIIQGIDEFDPSSGDKNRLRLEKEIADVLAQCYCCIAELGLDDDYIQKRKERKIHAMGVWEGLSNDK